VQSWNLGKWLFYQVVRGDADSLGYGALGRLGGRGEGISVESARTRAVEAAKFGALGEAWVASAGDDATFLKLAQKLGNQTNPTRISYQVNIQIGWDGLADRLSGIWKRGKQNGERTWWS